MARMRNAPGLVVVAAMLMLAGCSTAQGHEVDGHAIEMEEAAASETDIVDTVGAGPEVVDDDAWFDTWEEAALAEAERLHPGLSGLAAERLPVTWVTLKISAPTLRSEERKVSPLSSVSVSRMKSCL